MDDTHSITVHEIIHALEMLEEAYGEGEAIESIELIPSKGGKKAQILVETNGAFFPIDLPTEDYE